MAIITALCGDLHTNVPKRSEEARRIAYWIVDDAVARGAHFLGIGGDGVDGPMTERDRDWLIAFSDYAASFMPVLWLMGNHEIELSLRCLRGRQTKCPVIVEEGAGVHVIETAAGPLAVAAVAFPHKAKLLAAVGPVPGEEADQIAGQALQDIFRGLGVRVTELGLPTVGLFHGTIKGSKIGADDQPDRPLGLDVDIADLALMNCDFICAPHIHKANQFEWGGVTLAATPTSPFFADYGEATNFKGYILAEFDPQNPGGMIPTRVKWERVSTPAVPMLLLEDRWQGSEWEGTSLISSSTANGADIRFRYHFPADQRKAAVAAAEEQAATLKSWGAVNVVLDPVQTPTTKSRIPALATTVRLEDKIQLYWHAIGFNPSPERGNILIEMLHEIQSEAAAQGIAMGTTGRTAPSLKKIRGKGFLKFPEAFELDFTQMEGPLHAIVAPNEMGKSILMGLSGPGVLYGVTGNRGSLDDLSISKDSFIEAEFSMGGAEYRLAQMANGKDRKGSVSLIKNGVAELSKAGRAEYAAWASTNLLPRNVYDAVICQSGTESVIDMKDGPRVELLLRVLGLEIYEALAEMARKRAASVSTELAGVRQRIEELGEALILASFQDTVRHAKRALQGANEGLHIDTQVLATKREETAAIQNQRTEYNSLVTRRDELNAQALSLRDRIGQLQGKIEVNRELTAEKDAIEKAVADIAALETDLAAKTKLDNELRVSYATEMAKSAQISSEGEALRRQMATLEEEEKELVRQLSEVDIRIEETKAVVADADAIRLAAAESREYTAKWNSKREEISRLRLRETELAGSLSEIRARINGTAQQQSELVRRRNEASIAIEGKAGVLDAVAGVKNRTKDIETATAEIGRYRAEIEHLQVLMTSAAATESTALRAGHQDIISGFDPIPRATQAIEDADHAIEEAREGPARLVEVKSEVASCEEALRQYQRSLAGAQAEATRLTYIEASEKVLAETIAEIETVNTLLQSLIQESNEAITRQDGLVATREATERELRLLQEQITDLKPLTDRADLLATAETKLEGLGEQWAAIVSNRAATATKRGEIVTAHDERLFASESQQALVVSIGKQVKDNDLKIGGIQRMMEALRSLASKSGALAEAEIKLEQFLHQKSGLDAELEEVEHKRDGIELVEPPPPVDLAPYETAVTSARATVSDYQTRLALAEKELKDAEAKENRRQELAAQVRGLEERVSNWTLLGLHLGKDHLQREEISCAGPQLTDITNDFLRAAGDTRHTVSVETERLHSNKKQMIPTLDINIFDSEEGLTKESKRLSGAGKLLVGWPFILALITLGCERAGILGPTIMIDEATGPCDEVNAPRVIGMLRRFAGRLTCRVLFVSQQPDIQALADSRISIDQGKVSIS